MTIDGVYSLAILFAEVLPKSRFFGIDLLSW